MALAWCVLASSVAWADEYTAGQTPFEERFTHNFVRAHDRGLYARFSLGVGYVSDQVVPGVSVARDESRGMRTLYGAHVGGYVAPRLALHLSNFSELGFDRGTFGVGPGLTFYPFEDKNWLLSLSLGGVSLYDGAPDIEFLEQWGVGTEVECGTGWWASDHAAIGLSLVGGAHAFDLDGDGVASSSWHVGLRLSVSLD